jgi:hypothetical protein
MRQITRLIMIACAISTVVNAEIYMGIGPLDTLGDIKTKFPKAYLQKTNPAWAQKSDVMYQITGSGITGTIVIKLNDYRASWKEASEKEQDPKTKETYNSLANQPDDEAITVSWVRWVPDTPIPVQRLISKYGLPEKSGFSNDDFQPYRHWEAKGISAFLSDDEKHVVRIDFEFTQSDYRNAYIQKYNFVPDWLKESPHKLPSKQTKKTK